MATDPPSPTNSKSEPEPDPFDTLLDLESTYEAQGLSAGLHDGKAQAHTSALLFGIEQGFSKYLPFARLRYQAETWARQLGITLDTKAQVRAEKAPSRLERHVITLLALTDPATLDYANTDEAVGDAEERMGKAKAKCKIIEQIMGAGAGTAGSARNSKPSTLPGGSDIENPRLNMAALKGIDG